MNMNIFQKPFSCRASFISWLLLLGFIAIEVFKAKWKVCLPDGDCESYLQMVYHWGYSADILPHHAMRVLPSMIVYTVSQLGINEHMGFWLLSITSFILFAVGTYTLLAEKDRVSLLPVSLTLLLLSAHWAMTYSLSHFYQATDALIYPFGLLMFYFLRQNNSSGILLIGLLGCLVRQNLFVFGFFGLMQIAYVSGKKSDVLKLIVLCLGYVGATKYYQASGALLAHLIPPADYISLSVLWSVWLESELTWLLLPAIPVLLRNPEGVFNFFKRYPAVLMYGLIVTAQPFIAFDMTGQANFVRIAMQGIWPLYLAGAYSLISVAPNRKEQCLWVLYSLLLASTYSHSFRAMLVLFALLLLSVSAWRERNAIQSA